MQLVQKVLLAFYLVISKGRFLARTANQYYEKLSWTYGPCQIEIMENCQSDYIRFFLYTGKDQTPMPLKFTDTGPPKEYKPGWKTKVLIHGYAGDLEFNGTKLVRDAYLQVGNHNLIVVDWGSLVRLPCYPSAVINTLQAGRCTAKMLAHLDQLNTPGYKISKLHLIGFSLGAHVASFTSNYLQEATNKKIRRITGLDPALPLFVLPPNAYKLDRTDANFVDIIHTNSGVFGKVEATGHADFYVNGGFMQPACQKAQYPHLCSHLIATVYYAESIITRFSQGKPFKASKCSGFVDMMLKLCTLRSVSPVVMGEACTSKARGMFYVTTGYFPPFSVYRGKLSNSKKPARPKR